MTTRDTDTDTPVSTPRNANLILYARKLVFPVTIALIVTLVYTLFAAWQWQAFTVKSWDLGIFTQLLAHYASFDAPIVDLKGHEYNLLGDHFHPLLVILAPFYALFPSAFTLLVLQAACFGVAAGVVAHTVRKLLGFSAAVWLSLAFGFSWGLQNAAEAQFHEIALAVPLLAASLMMMLEKNWLWSVIWAAPLVFVKEDLGLTVAVIGIVIAVRFRKTLGIWLAVWGIGWLVIAVLVVLPLLNPDGQFAYGDRANPFEVLTNLPRLFHPDKGLTLVMLFAITAGLAVISPVALIMLPTLAWRFLSTQEGYFGPTWHYSAVLMPIAFAVLVDGMFRARRDVWRWVRRYARHAVAVAATVAIMMMPQLPLWDMLTPWNGTPRAEAARGALAAVPEGAVVESDLGLMNYLVDDHRLYWIGNDNPAPDCLVLDLLAGNTPDDWGSILEVAAHLHPGITYEVRYDSSDYQVACQPTSH